MVRAFVELVQFLALREAVGALLPVILGALERMTAAPTPQRKKFQAKPNAFFIPKRGVVDYLRVVD